MLCCADNYFDRMLKINVPCNKVYQISENRQNLMRTLYVRPHFNYCDIICDRHLNDGHLTISDKLRPERLQNRAARLVTGALPRTSTNKLKQEFVWVRLQTRRKIHRLTLYRQLQADATHMPDYIRSTIPSAREYSTGRALRNQNQHTVSYSRTCIYQSSLIVCWSFKGPSTVRSLCAHNLQFYKANGTRRS